MKKGSDLDKNGISQNNLGLFFNMIHDSLNIKQLIYMISACFEFSQLKISRDQEQELNELRDYLSYFPKGKQASPQMVKVAFLLLAHVDRVEISPSLQKDQKNIISTTLRIINSVIESAFMFNHIPKGKKISPATFDLFIDFSRSLVQLIPFQSPCSLMIPDIKDNKLFNKCNSLEEIRGVLMSAKTGLKINKNEVENIKKKLEDIPEFIVEGKVYVDGENDIRLGDILTISLIISRTGDKESCAIVNSPLLGLEKKEKIWLIIADGKKTIFIKSFENEEKIIEDKSIQIPLDRKLGFATGKQNLDIYVKSDSYLGIDKMISIDFIVLNPLKQTN